MKIDKVLFSSSETFSVFWNVQARLWRSMGIEPVCLLFGKRDKTDMTEEHGRVIEVPVSSRWPLLIQITWSKFWWPKTEPDKTWLVSDIDLLPLSSRKFVEDLVQVRSDAYVHLDADGITQLSGSRSWTGRGEVTPFNMPPPHGHPTNLPGHYHCGLGRVLTTGLDQKGSREEEIQRVIDSGIRNTRGFRHDDPIEQHGLWCVEEHWSTRQLRKSIVDQRVVFKPFSMRHGIDRITGERLDKSMYDMEKGHYHFDEARLRAGEYADLHCARPFPQHYLPEECAKRWSAIEEVLQIAGV